MIIGFVEEACTAPVDCNRATGEDADPSEARNVPCRSEESGRGVLLGEFGARCALLSGLGTHLVREAGVDTGVCPVGGQLLLVDSRGVPQVERHAGYCELCREVHSGVADSVSSDHDLSGGEDLVRGDELYAAVS